MVERFDPTLRWAGHGMLLADVVRRDDGEFVRHSDYAALSAKLAEAERERDEAKQSIGMAQSQAEAAKTKLRMIVSHATMGATTGEGMSVNDISVKISEGRNALYNDGKKRGADAAEARVAEAERLWQKLRGLFGLDGWYDGHWNGVPNPAQIVTHIEYIADERAKHQARVAELEKALKPFAEVAETAQKLADLHGANEFVLSFGPAPIGVIPLGCFTEASAALSATKEPNNG